MRVLFIFLALAVVVWGVVLGGAVNRAERHLEGRIRLVQAALDSTTTHLRDEQDLIAEALQGQAAVMTLLDTWSAAPSAVERAVARDTLAAMLTHRHETLGHEQMWAHALLDRQGHLLWVAPGAEGRILDGRDTSSLVARVLVERESAWAFDADLGMVVVTPLMDEGRMVALLKGWVPADSLGRILERATGVIETLRPAFPVDRILAPGGAAPLLDRLLASLDPKELERIARAEAPLALYGRGEPGALLVLPLRDDQGRVIGGLLGAWATEVHLMTRWVYLPLLGGGTALLLLFFLTLVKLRRIWGRAERDRNRLMTVMDTMAEGLCVLDAETRILSVNAAAERMLGRTTGEMVGQVAHDVFHVHGEDQGGHGSLEDCPIHQAILGRRELDLSTEVFRRANGEAFPVAIRCAPVDKAALSRLLEDRSRRWSVSRRLFEWILGSGPPTSIWAGQEEEGLSVVTFSDLSEHHHSQATVDKLSQAVEQSSASVVITDAEGVIEYVNPAFTRISGYPADEVVGKKPSLLKSGRVEDETYRHLWDTITGGEAWKGEFHNRRKDGSLYWERATIAPIRASDGEITHFVAVKDDITEWKGVEQELFHRANYDALTGLPNRQFLLERLAQVLAVARREGHFVAVLFMDLDRFKQVNDSMGHNAGDVLLKQAASRMAAVLRPQDILGRLGGDEFLVISPGLKSEAEAATIAARLLEVVREPFTIDGRDAYVSGSIGIGIGPEGEEGREGKPSGGRRSGHRGGGAVSLAAQTLLRHADAAMYLAKEEGRDGYHFFTEKLEAAARRRLAIEAGLRTATTDGSLSLAFQPVLNAVHGKVIKVEALLRWTHGELGTVWPDEFIPLAEETGQILGLGDWVIEAACDAVETIDPPRDGSFRLAFNVSSKQFAEDVAAKLLAALETRRLDPRVMEVEITERLMLDTTSGARDQLNTLRGRGVHVAIDDFGTGYSALSYLTHFHIDTLKIDRAFVSGIVGDMRGQALIGAITGMAHGLDCTVVAEGVETEDQAGLLKDLGVDALQGFLLGRPMPLEDLVEDLKTREGWGEHPAEG